MSFLTKNGLIKLWGHIKDLVATKLDAIFGTEYSGMYLAIDATGNVVPRTLEEITNEQVDAIIDNVCGTSVIFGDETEF